ncbi:hypothetical protein FB451DRAFT_246259 [Mycena latifolia]|nr:hypothetical protein FB451DRAFT_246259 [Mycena latifolia]
MDGPPSPSFSVLEFGDIVSAALDSPEPSLSFTNLPLVTSALERRKSSRNLQGTTTSRVLLALTKLKKQAAALMKRPRQRFRYSEPLPLPRVLSPSVTDIDIEDGCDSPGEAFTPYLPLVVQYERMSRYAIPTSPSTSTLPTCRASTSLSNSPPSPTTSVFSSECSSADTHLPATPQYMLPRPWSALGTYGDDLSNDPFAKDDVRIVNRSCEVLSSSPPPVRRRRRPGRLPRTYLLTTPPAPEDWTHYIPDTPTSSAFSSSSTPAQATSPESAAPRLGRSSSLAPRLPRAGSPFPLTLRRTQTAHAQLPCASEGAY